MDDKKLYNKLLKLELPWFVRKVDYNEPEQRIDIYIDHEPDIRARCPVYDRFYSVYDHAPERIFRHLDTCHMQTHVHVRLPRVQCPEHGVKQILSDFGESGSEMTYAFENYVLRIAQECSITAMASLCGLIWDQSLNAMHQAVNRRRSRKKYLLLRRIGVDEKSFGRGHTYETLVYDIDGGTVEYVGDNRDQQSLELYYEQFTPKERRQVEAIAMVYVGSLYCSNQSLYS